MGEYSVRFVLKTYGSLTPCFAVLLILFGACSVSSAQSGTNGRRCPPSYQNRFYGWCSGPVIKRLTGVRAGDDVAVLLEAENGDGASESDMFFVHLFRDLVGATGRVYRVPPNKVFKQLLDQADNLSKEHTDKALQAAPLTGLIGLPPLTVIWSVGNAGLLDFRPFGPNSFTSIVRALKPGGVFVVADTDRQAPCLPSKRDCPAQRQTSLYGESHDCVIQDIERAGLFLRLELTRIYDPFKEKPFWFSMRPIAREQTSFFPFMWIWERPAGGVVSQEPTACVPLLPNGY
jgi:predicted methyltransferase